MCVEFPSTIQCFPLENRTAQDVGYVSVTTTDSVESGVRRAGAYSILTGIAANGSIEEGQAVRIPDLVRGIGYPDYPPMPSPGDAIPTPAHTDAAPAWFIQ